ncbi:MAG: hypothetical protein KGL18_10775 [Burkholderiales bacterium]|nr:hypothetical protein [Burkholderiales bacterium]MDE1926276.1 hypothetical protein [Burkholderiales bacterium]MDE2157446.1 hypothetical protein [Burkholderiales bacterium]MDE2503440.1 hypothetical protein [Burkholderiales bacterium]
MHEWKRRKADHAQACRHGHLKAQPDGKTCSVGDEGSARRLPGECRDPDEA